MTAVTIRAVGVSAVAALAVAACRATTARPSFTPFPEAEHSEIGFDLAGEDETIFMVTDTVAARLLADSVPLAKVRRFDGFIESRWFDAKTKQPIAGRPLGPDAVRVRAWIDPGKPGYSKIEIETVYVPKVDPSLPDREQEAPVATEHPVNRKMGELLKALAVTYGVPEEEKAPAEGGPAAGPGARLPGRHHPGRPRHHGPARHHRSPAGDAGPAQAAAGVPAATSPTATSPAAARQSGARLTLDVGPPIRRHLAGG